MVTTDYIDGVAQTPVTSVRTYLIGDDVIAQRTGGNTQYLLYDGHGSTRQLAEYDTAVTIAEDYSYDGYGVLLQDENTFPPNGTQTPGKVDTQAASLLYAGEQWDTSAQMYYLRARYYNPSNGLFNNVDPYAGNMQDPQSLHKYLYCHANPINGIDPSGEFGFFISSVISISILSSISAIMGGIMGGIGARKDGVGGIFKGIFFGALKAGIGTALSLTFLSIFSMFMGPFAAPLSFGLSSAIITFAEIAITKHSFQFEWEDWVQVILSFVVAATMGAVFGGGSNDLRMRIADRIRDLSFVRGKLAQLASGGMPEWQQINFSIKGITPGNAMAAFETVKGQFQNEMKDIIKDLVMGDIVKKITTSLITPIATGIANFCMAFAKKADE